MKSLLSLLFFAALATVAMLFGLTVTGDGQTAGISGSGQATWVAGMISGVLIAWIARIRWAELPLRMALWMRIQRRKFGWMACGILCVCVLMLL